MVVDVTGTGARAECSQHAAAVARSQTRHPHVLPNAFQANIEPNLIIPYDVQLCSVLAADMDEFSSCSAADPRAARGDGDERGAKDVTTLELATPTLAPGSHSDGSAQTLNHIVIHHDVVDDKPGAPASAPAAVCPGHKHLRLHDPRVHIQKVHEADESVLEYVFDGLPEELADIDPYRCAPI